MKKQFLAGSIALMLCACATACTAEQTNSSTGDSLPAVTTAQTETTPAETTATTTTALAHTTMAAEDAVSALDENSLLILGAEKFDEACELYWDFTTGDGPYTLDLNVTAEQQDTGMPGYQVTDDAVRTVADVEADFRKHFADTIPFAVSQRFFEQDGKLYCIAGDRGKDITYNGCQVDFKEKTDTGLHYTVHAFRADPDTGETQPEDTYEFALVPRDGDWIVSTFTLPY